MSAFTNLLSNCFDFIYRFVQDYGWSIFIFTVLFRVVLMPLDYFSRRSMKRQSDLTPQINALQKKYANDKDKLAQKTTELYRANGVNPLAGCLPLLIQLPVFFAFFAAIRLISEQQTFAIYEAMRTTGQAAIPGFYWVHNLWQPDTFFSSVIPTFESLSRISLFSGVTDYEAVMAPLAQSFEGLKNGYFILPVVAGLASFFQSKQSMKNQPQPQGNDANGCSSKSMMYMMPVMSVFFCITSSAAFALYWIASSLTSICTYAIIDKILSKQTLQKKAMAAEAPAIEVPETRRERHERMRREAEEAARQAAEGRSQGDGEDR